MLGASYLLLPARHVPVGYRWQNSGYGQSVLRMPYSYIGDLVSHPNNQAQQWRELCNLYTLGTRLSLHACWHRLPLPARNIVRNQGGWSSERRKGGQVRLLKPFAVHSW